jgi:hypothetical protein
MCACVCVRARARVRACVCARACVCVYGCVCRDESEKAFEITNCMIKSTRGHNKILESIIQHDSPDSVVSTLFYRRAAHLQ